PHCVALSASSSESYSWLFKLCCDPGDRVLVPQPSYPLFEHLAALESVAMTPYALGYHGRWDVDLAQVERGLANGARMVVAVSPNNPTGSWLSAAEADALIALTARAGVPLVVDEVFADYPIEPGPDVATDVAGRADGHPGALVVTLGGLSKSVGLPQLKLGWMVLGGDAAIVRQALGGLELVADSYLSVSTPVQVAAAALLNEGAAIRAQIQQRIRTNLEALRAAVAAHPACDVLPVEGGWSAVLRVPATRTEEQLVLDLLRQEHVLVHPGYFFDFAHEAWLVVSLLPPPDVFAAAIARTLAFASAR
ncbi:MAG: pyridoxal phosphate-dependent aminotransferase, partial [Alphaproteobacteria bacterium]